MDHARPDLYLDFNATTPPAPEVADAVAEALVRVWGNPSSGHAPGLAARDLVERARGRTAALFGVDASQVVFTGGGTEAITIGMWSAWRARDAHRTRVVVSAVEHPAVLGAARYLASQGAEVVTCPVDGHGLVDLDRFTELVADRAACAAVMHANNEVGTLQPVEDAARAARAAGVRFLCDTVQSAGKIPVTLDAIGADYIVCAAHKLYGPKGVGCLVRRREAPLAAVVPGGGQEGGVRSGTENVPGIAGLGEACRLAMVAPGDAPAVAALRDALQVRLVDALDGRAVAAGAPRLPNTLGIVFPGVDAHALLVRLSRRGVYVSGGSACSTGAQTMSHVLKAMRVSARDAASFVRVSLGRHTAVEDVGRAGAIIIEEVRALRARR